MSPSRAALHFAGLGALLYVIALASGSIGPTRSEAVLPGIAVRDPSEAALVRAGLEAGEHRRDPLARARLVALAGFVGDGPATSPDALVDQAIELGLHRSDPVVRSRLLQLARLRARADARRHPPAESELRAYYERHRERFRLAPRVRISHERTAAAGDGVASGDATPAEAPGEPLPLPTHLPLLSQHELAGLFGSRFADRVDALPVGAQAQVASAYGLHRVRVHERVPGRLPSYTSVRIRVREALLAARESEALAHAVARLRGGAG